MMHQIIGFALSYFAVGLALTIWRAWKVGVHRSDDRHKGREISLCSHWACDGMVVESLVAIFLLWPVALPAGVAIDVVGWFFRKLIEAPYEMRRPPLNEHPTAKQVCSICQGTHSESYHIGPYRG